MNALQNIRIDKWLWAVRIFKTRSMASQACDKGKIKLNGEVIKPSRHVRISDAISLSDGTLTRTFEVMELLSTRVGAKLAINYCKETTPEADILNHLALRKAAEQWRMPGEGRPTKKERRELDDFIWGGNYGEF
ncbi:MAG: RNA-binding S4 domain-containing protein [Bacteroidetes bacterium]|nr:RNA-binding S4 domain-containing protein [Bacteroidota bacterium]